MKEKASQNFFTRMATFIVDKRNLFFLLYLFAAVFCLFSMGWVQVENDVTQYLPESTETRLGIEAMNTNFTTIGTGQIMVSNITYDTAETLYDEMLAVDGVEMVTFDDTEDHWKDACALYDITFSGGNFDEVSLNALAEIETLQEGYDTSFYTQVGYDENAMLDDEMTTILIVAVVIILVVLAIALTS